ncbi:MAG: hypothetical protein U5N86_06765 [Planctomycetota bacterium]|nr:hypothetical protein [Planctomycetota bacterium]
MTKLRLTIVLCLVLTLFVSPPFFAEEGEDGEKQEQSIGDPNCPKCHGTGIVTPQDLAKRGRKDVKQYILYCSEKASGRRCDVLIGGWAPCERCKDRPGMDTIVRQHNQIIDHYKMRASEFDFLDEAGYRMKYYEGVHFRLVTNCSHGMAHGVINSIEKSWDVFSYEWGLLPMSHIRKQPKAMEEIEEIPGGDPFGAMMWENMWRQSQPVIYLFNSKAMYAKFLDYYWKNGGSGKHGMGGLALLKKCASFGVMNQFPRAGRPTTVAQSRFTAA